MSVSSPGAARAYRLATDFPEPRDEFLGRFVFDAETLPTFVPLPAEVPA